jgi:hypothetical protein
MSLGMYCAAGCAAAAVSPRVSSRWQHTSTALNVLFVTRSRSFYDPRLTGRPIDELIQLGVLEGSLDRLTKSQHTENFVLKWGYRFETALED